MLQRPRLWHLLAIFLIPLLGLGAGRAPATTDAPASASPYLCEASLGVPVDLEISAPENLVAVGATVDVQLLVRAHADLNTVDLRLETEGAVQLAGAPSITLDPMMKGEERTIAVPVTITAEDASVVTAHLVATNLDAAFPWERNEELHTIFSYGRAYVGPGSDIPLKLRAIQEAVRDGRMTTVESDEALSQALRLEGEAVDIPVRDRMLVSDPMGASSLISPIAPEGKSVSPDAAPAAGCITIQGNVSWLDENGVVHPAFGMSVQIWDEDLGFDEFVDVVATDVNGNYSISVNNDDGLGAGDRDIYVKFVTANTAIAVIPPGGDPYEADSPVHDETPCGDVITENFVCANTGTGPACNLLECGSYVASYTAQRLNGGSFLGQIDVHWPGSTGSANYNGSRINLRPGDQWDWDVLMHEYGHYVQDTFDIENNPGGPHNIGDCISDVHSSKDEGVRMAFGEGWPTYNGTVAQEYYNLAALNVPRVGDVSYTDTGESNFTYSLEAQDNLGLGEDNEIAIQRIYWDWYDGPADGTDNLSVSDVTLFTQMQPSHPTTFSAAWAAHRSGLSDADLLLYGAATTNHQVGPKLNSPAAGSIVSPSSANFSWQRYVGCSTTYDGDGFTLRFFNAATKAPILSLPVGNVTSRSLSLAELQTLVASSHQVLWAVEGSNSSGPATGPYLGENFAITVNQPPVADAGPDQPSVECESATTTAATVNGAGSSDPDGDPLTYQWSAPGVTFDNPNAVTTDGHFPKGSTVVTLTVSDGIEQDTDQMVVTVVDTTPPVIVCPPPITVECTSHDGTPKDDAQLVPFFGGVSATDVCDSSPAISDDAPDYFELGETVVTFTATDEDGNESQCQATVTVEDTTPPEIAVELNRDCLWPPNHKMVDILATVEVTDICDPNPTFVLTSIESSEPDNDKGDGNTTGDIQADLGTPDVDFLLRSERSGGGDGRVYTIVYTASDASGNSAPDTVTVRVPHDQSGSAACAVGFAANGAALDPAAIAFRMVVYSSPGMDAWRIDPRRVYVGNDAVVMSPTQWRLVDVDKDRVLDLELTYDAARARDMRQLSSKQNPLGLHYQGSDQVDYLVADIFGLGTPITVADAPEERGDEDQAKVIGADDPAEIQAQDPGVAVGGTEVTPGITAGAQGASLTLAEGGAVTVEIFNVTGRRVRILVNADMARGLHSLTWDGRDDSGRRMPGGIYFYRVEAPGLRAVKKVLLAR